MDAYIFLAHYIINVGVSAFSIKISSNILFKKISIKNSSNLAPIILLYVGYSLLLSLTTFFHYLYVLVLWRPEGNIYDARILFALGGLSTLISLLHSFVEIFLCIERCIIVVFPLKYSQKLKILFSTSSVIISILTHVIVFVKSSLLTNFPSTSSTSCRMYYCIGFIFPQQYSQLVKVIFASANILLCISLYFLLKKFTNDKSKTSKRINKTIMYMTIATVFVDLTPNLIGQLYFNITQKQLFDIIGPFSLTASNINSTICLWLCYRAVKKSFNNTVIIISSENKIKTNTTLA